MGLKIPKVMIAAVKSGSGKTTITCAFLKQLLCRKKHPVSFSADRIILIRCFMNRC